MAAFYGTGYTISYCYLLQYAPCLLVAGHCHNTSFPVRPSYLEIIFIYRDYSFQGNAAWSSIIVLKSYASCLKTDPVITQGSTSKNYYL